MNSNQQIQRTDDTHELCRISMVRFVGLDYTIQYSLKSLASSVGEQISINLENPYSIDIDQEVIKVALDRLKFSSIHFNNCFSKYPAVIDSENEKLQEFLIYYFDVERKFLENALPHPNTITDNPSEMKKVTIHDVDSTTITIHGVTEKTEKNLSPTLTIKHKDGREKAYDLVVEKVTTISSDVANYRIYQSHHEKRRSEIAKAYLNYRTDLFLQEILSFFIRYPDKIDELVLPSTTEDSIKAEFDLTTRIENVTSSSPSYNIVKLLLKIFAAMASPLLLDHSTPDEETFWGHLIPQMTVSELNSNRDGLPFTPETIIDSAGLTVIRSELSDLLAVDLAEGIDVFEDIIDICSGLFNDNLSEDMRFLDSQLPTVISRFQTSQATPDQQVHFFRASDIVTRVLKNAISRERISDLHAVSVSLKSTSITVHFLRSLYDLPKSFDRSHTLNQSWAKSSWYDLALLDRTDFLHIIWWMLSIDSKLYKIYEYCRKRTAIDKSDIESGLVPPALFPGSLVEPLNGIISLSTVYEIQKIRNKETAEMLKAPNGIEKFMSDARGRAI